MFRAREKDTDCTDTTDFKLRFSAKSVGSSPLFPPPQDIPGRFFVY